MERGELFAFVVDPVFVDKFEHIHDYITTAYQDSVMRHDANVKAEATKEFNGIPKVENLDVLYNKANDYFSRGIYKDASSTEGMKLVMECTKGFKWYQLQTREAFEREGKILQNCIGRVYTAQRCADDGTSIVILRDKNQNTHVAMRLRGGEVQEMKGKNNKPPMLMYMPPLREFFDKFTTYRFSQTAINDILGGGYYPIKTRIMPVAEAIRELCDTVDLGTSANGNTIYEITSKDSDIFSEVMRPITTSNMRQYFYYGRRGVSNIKLYESVANGHLVATCSVDNGKLVDVWSSRITEAEGDDEANKFKDNTIQDLVRFLVKAKKFATVDDSVARTLSFKYKMHLDFKTGDIAPIKADESFYAMIPSGKVPVSKYAGDQAKSLSALAGEESGTVYEILDDSAGEPNQYDHSQDYAFTMLTLTKDNVLLPFTMDVSGRADYKDLQMLKSSAAIAQVANKAKAHLPLAFCAQTSIASENGEYKQVRYKPKQVTESVFKLDVGDVSEVNKFIAAVASMQQWGIGTNGALYKMGNFREYSNMNDLDPVKTKYEMDKLDPSVALTNNMMTNAYLAEKWKEFATTQMGGRSPTAIYFTPTVPQYSSDDMLWMAVDGKEIISIDCFEKSWTRYRSNQRFAKSRQSTDLESGPRKALAKKSAEINQLIEKEGLTVTEDVAKKNPYLHVEGNKTYAPNTRAFKPIEARPETVIGTTFTDGTVARRLTGDEYNTWLEGSREDNITNKVPYGVFENAEATVPKTVFLVRGSRVTGVYKGTATENSYETKVFPTTAKYVKAFATTHHLALPIDTTGMIKPTSKMTRFMRRISQSATRPSKLHNYEFPALHVLGLTSVTHTGGRYQTYLKQAGINALRTLDGGNNVNMYELVQAAEVAAVDRPVAVPAAPRAQGVANVGGREGTKAQMAVARFREMAQANNGTPPARGEFIAVLRQPPFDMTPAGASTYYHNIKVKYAQEQGQVGETFSFKDFLMIVG
jgi:hypothetical protein